MEKNVFLRKRPLVVALLLLFSFLSGLKKNFKDVAVTDERDMQFLNKSSSALLAAGDLSERADTTAPPTRDF